MTTSPLLCVKVARYITMYHYKPNNHTNFNYMKYYSKIVTFVSSIALISSLVLSPALTYAKDNDNGKGKNEPAKVAQAQAKAEVKANKESEKEDKSCIRAFGHLIAPGWIKNNSQLTIGDECNLPFGIGKKFGGDHPTTTPPVADVTAPVISALSINARVNNALVHWTTNERANSTVFYSATTPVDINASGTASVTVNPLVTNHWVALKSLASSTTYYVIVRSTDASGNTSTSSQISFKTLASSGTTDTKAPVISNIVSVTGTTSAQIGWTTDEYATSKVYYSSSSTIDVNSTSTTFVEKSSLDKNHLLNVTGLAASSTSYFIIESTDASGNTSRSPVFSATTGAVVPVTDTTAPVITNALAVVGSTYVQLSWNTNEAATTKAYYSTSTPVDVTASTTAFTENVSLVTAHTATVSALATSTQYHMILESKDAASNTTRTAEFAFTTTSGM